MRRFIVAAAFVGILGTYDNAGLTGTPLFSTPTLTSAGTVRIEFASVSGSTNAESHRITYTFADTDPVPEPATMLLLGSGLAGMVAARRGRTRARS